MPDRVLITKEVAEMLRVSERTVRRWAKQGRIPGVRIGKDWYFLESELLAVLRGRGSPKDEERSEGP